MHKLIGFFILIPWYRVQEWRGHRLIEKRQAQYRFWFAESHKPDVPRVIKKRFDQAREDLRTAEDKLCWAKWNKRRLGG